MVEDRLDKAAPIPRTPASLEVISRGADTEAGKGKGKGTLRACLLVAFAAIVSAACAPQSPRQVASPAATELPAEFPDIDYQQAAARGEPVYRIEPERSLVVIEVRRGGLLARLGHDHVVASRGVQGYVTLGQRRADLYVALDRLTIDEAALRVAAGFDTQPSPSDIEGTRANMLDKVLQVERHPRLLVRVRPRARGDGGVGDSGDMEAAITLHGVTRTLPVAVRLEGDRDMVTASGTFSVLQSDFGITPFTILGGAIQVQDRLAVRFELRAKRFRP